MSQLDPELRRLIQWSRAGDSKSPAEAPFGSITRIAGRSLAGVSSEESNWWSRGQLATAWVSITIVAAGLIFWTTQLRRPTTAYDFAPAYQLIAQNIAP